MRTVQLNIPLGYKTEEEKCKLPVEQARELLLTKKQKKYTRADRDDYTVELTSHFIRCPHCNYKIRVYARELNRVFGCRVWPDAKVGKDLILDWTSQQMTIFEEERKPLFLSRVVDVHTDLTCPNCKNTMHHSDKTRHVELKHANHKVYIRAEVLDIMELFSLPCLSTGEVRVEFPLFEVACFNFRNGHSYIRLETPDGRCLAVRDLTSDKYAWTSGAVYNAVSKNKYVRRIVRNMFNDEWNSKIPFCPSELGVNEMRMLTMFVGYDRAFYSAIPFTKGSLAVDDSFKIQARKMRDADDIVSLYKKSKLPNMKSIKKILFDNEGLFFYLEECERLWGLFNDPNYFVTLLKEGEIYQILSDLHMRPMIFDFLEDYLKTGRIKHLLKLIHKYWHSVCRYAVNYGSMSKHMRKSEQTKWIKHESGSTIGGFPSFAIPMCNPTERIRDCSIDEFEFSWLKNSVDYEEAGKELNNCLRDWSTYNYPVVCVRKAGKIIAALEVRNDFVFQAFTSNNDSLRKIPGLLKAYYKWHAKNNLSDKYVPLPRANHDDRYELEDDEDLPF